MTVKANTAQVQNKTAKRHAGLTQTKIPPSPRGLRRYRRRRRHRRGEDVARVRERNREEREERAADGSRELNRTVVVVLLLFPFRLKCEGSKSKRTRD